MEQHRTTLSPCPAPPVAAGPGAARLPSARASSDGFPGGQDDPRALLAIDGHIARPGPAVLRLRGELDLHTSPLLAEAVQSMFDEEMGDRLVLHLAELTFCDASGIAALLAARREAGRLGVSLYLAEPRPGLRKLLDILSLTAALPLWEQPVDAAAVAAPQLGAGARWPQSAARGRLIGPRRSENTLSAEGRQRACGG